MVSVWYCTPLKIKKINHYFDISKDLNFNGYLVIKSIPEIVILFVVFYPVDKYLVVERML